VGSAPAAPSSAGHPARSGTSGAGSWPTVPSTSGVERPTARERAQARSVTSTLDREREQARLREVGVGIGGVGASQGRRGRGAPGPLGQLGGQRQLLARELLRQLGGPEIDPGAPGLEPAREGLGSGLRLDRGGLAGGRIAAGATEPRRGSPDGDGQLPLRPGGARPWARPAGWRSTTRLAGSEEMWPPPSRLTWGPARSAPATARGAVGEAEGRRRR